MFSLPKDIPRGLPNCGLVALRVATQCSYGYIESYWHDKRQGNWKGRTYKNEIVDCLETVTEDYHEIKLHSGKKDKTLKRVYEAGYLGGVDTPYIVWVGGHVLTVYNGYVIDQHEDEAKFVDVFRGKQKRVSKIIAVTDPKIKKRWKEKLRKGK